MTRRRWSEEEIAYLRCHGHMGASYMARDLNRSEAAIYQAASKHGIPLGGTLGPRRRIAA